jgi:four helix bundle protein
MTMDTDHKPRRFDLEMRTETFARKVAAFVERLPKGLVNIEFTKQLVRSSASVGANYIEANEALSKKEFLMKAKIGRKEAKETGYWLRLVRCPEEQMKEQAELLQEATKLLKIFGAIVTKSS